MSITQKLIRSDTIPHWERCLYTVSLHKHGKYSPKERENKGGSEEEQRLRRRHIMCEGQNVTRHSVTFEGI